MLIKINRTLLDLETLLTRVSQGDVWCMSAEIKEAVNKLKTYKQMLEADSLYKGQYKKELDTIDEQLYFLEENIKTIEEVLLCHESKIFEYSVRLGDLGMLCAN